MSWGLGGTLISSGVKFTEPVVQKKRNRAKNQLLNAKPVEAAGTVMNVHAVLQVCYLLCTPAARSSSPVSSATSLPSLSNGRRGVTWRAAEDQWHAGGDPKENGQPVQTRQHLHHRRVAAPGRTQLCHQQVHEFSSTCLMITTCELLCWRSS